MKNVIVTGANGFLGKALVRALLGGENYRSLAVGVDGKLGESIVTMLSEATGCAGILYDAVETDFDAWQESVISSLMTK